MAVDTKKLYAIKKCINGTLTELGGTSKEVKVDFCNSFDMESSGEKVTARADGEDAINITSSVKRSFKLGAECMTDEAFALILGGTVDDTTGEIKVLKAPPTTCYSYAGVFTVVYTDGTIGVREVTIPKVQPAIDTSVNFSSIDLSTFEIPFDILSGDEDYVFSMKPKADAGV